MSYQSKDCNGTLRNNGWQASKFILHNEVDLELMKSIPSRVFSFFQRTV